jgi:predicted ATPase with chaperone activity
MKQERMHYADVMALGFTSELVKDTVYFNEYGFDYCIINKNLTPLIYLDWAKETQLCVMCRINNEQDTKIVKRLPIRDLDHLKEIVNFFSDEKFYPEKQNDCIYNAC